MKILFTKVVLVALACYTLTSCSQTTTAAKKVAAVSASNFDFETNLRPGGSAFYAMSSATGGISYMLDHGEKQGEWFNYGNTIRETGTAELLLEVQEVASGTVFYAMDAGTGQVYFMKDYGDAPGEWQKFGGMIRQNGLNMLQFDATFRDPATTFYAYDSFTHQTYYLNDMGDNAGKWQKYGVPYTAKK